jgi:hypothetical protein
MRMDERGMTPLSISSPPCLLIHLLCIHLCSFVFVSLSLCSLLTPHSLCFFCPCVFCLQIEEIAPFTAEIDDYNSERKEVMTDQGSAFPYTRGLWLLSNLIAALNPDDLDAMDESVPFSKHTLDEMLGRYHTPEEYHYYFKHNPHSNRFQEHFEELATVPQPARKIIPAHKLPKPIARSRSKNESYLFVFVVVFLFVVWCLFSKR